MAKKLERGAEKQDTDLPGSEQDSDSQRDMLPSVDEDKTSQLSSGQDSANELDAQIAERIALEVERRFQSAKDKRWSKLERQLGALNEFQNSQSGGETDEGESPGEMNGEDALARKTSALQDSLGLLNDPDVNALFESASYSQDTEGYIDMLTDITKLALERSKRPVATAASVIQPSGRSAPAPDLRSDYDTRKTRLRPGDVNALMELKREFRKKGLEVF